MNTCERLTEIVEAFSRTHDREVMERMRGLGDVRECIVLGLHSSATTTDWKSFGSYVIAAFHQPDRSMTPVLCEVLERRNNGVPANVVDDIVDVLNDLGDPAAVGPLEEAMLNPPEWDEFYHFAKKCLWALLNIGTSEASAAVRRATQSDIPEIREEALRQLGRAEE